MLRPGRASRLLAQDRSGVAAIEFAFMAPILILLFVGLTQLSMAAIALRHTDHAASTLGDLVSQCSNINDSDLSNIFAAGTDLMSPLSADATLLGQRVTSVLQTDANGTTQAQWTSASDPNGLTTSYANGSSVPLPSNVVTGKGDSVILSETVYKYTFPFWALGVLPTGANPISLSFGKAAIFDRKSYFKPRKSALVTYTGTGPGGTNAGGSTQGASCYSS